MADKMTTCKACGKEIAKSAKKCPSCGADQRNFFGKHKISTGIGTLIILIVVISAANGGSKSTPTTSAPAAQPAQTEQAKPAATTNKPTITKAEFDKVQNGMTYDEITAIIGGPGEMLSESGNKGDQFHTVMYTYKGEGDLGANANFTFQGEKLQNKSQIGLK